MKHNDLLKRLTSLGVIEDDLEIKFIKGRGPGGQKINKTASCVWLKHPPSGLIIKCQESRSQSQNYLRAIEIFCDKLEQRVATEKLRLRQEKEKLRRKNRKRSKNQKEVVLKTKKHRSLTKVRRSKVKDFES